jgi:peroxiredoxin
MGPCARTGRGKLLDMVDSWSPAIRAADWLARMAFVASCVVLAFAVIGPSLAAAQQADIIWSEQEKPIRAQIKTIRDVPDDKRGAVTKDLAMQIRQLPAGENKVRLAVGLAGRATEGDYGHDTLQEVASTLAAALRENPVPDTKGEPAFAYSELAQLVRYEHVQVSLDSPSYSAAMAKLEAAERQRAQADFTLPDLQGKEWNLKSLRGKVVLVNFWATWCPPCRKEMPDLNGLYARFQDHGFVILAISDEDAPTVKPFIAEHKINYPILLDKDRTVNEEFRVEGIPKTYVYDREGKLVAQSIDMRTQKQFLDMLGKAGLQ